AEDMAILAREVRHALEIAGMAVVGPARTVSEALRLATHAELHAAVLDIDLNGQRIDPVAERLAERNVPYLFVTGFESPGLPAGLRRAPVLHKPLDYDQLRRTVREVIDAAPPGRGE